MTCEQRTRQDIKAFKALITTPGSLITGFNLPANADLYVSTTSVLAVTTLLVDSKGRALGAPAGAANKVYHIGWFERGRNVIKHAGAPGTVSLYVRNGLGKLFKIGG